LGIVWLLPIFWCPLMNFIFICFTFAFIQRVTFIIMIVFFLVYRISFNLWSKFCFTFYRFVCGLFWTSLNDLLAKSLSYSLLCLNIIFLQIKWTFTWCMDWNRFFFFLRVSLNSTDLKTSIRLQIFAGIFFL
jgi:hypothetical protein